MRSSGKHLAACAVALLVAITVTAERTGAQSTQAKSLYGQVLERETSLRKELDAATVPADALVRVRTLVGSYKDMAELFPTSGYSDNALWQGAMLAADAFRRFGDPSDRGTAVQMLEALTTRFKGSTLAKKAPAELKRLAQGGAASEQSTSLTPTPAPQVMPTQVAPVRPPQPAPPATSRDAAGTGGAPVLLTAIRRESLPDALRVTLELEREVPFHDEQIAGPHRVFLDLRNTKAIPELRDAVLPFDDPLLQRVRVGRQLDSRTRVVLDLTSSARYSVYTLYNPYRVVIDFERGTKASAIDGAAADKPAAGPAGTPAIAPTTTARNAPATDSAIAPPSANTSGSYSLSRQLGLGVARIVIDPGHGGHDPGAKARGLSESDLVLDVALRLEKLLLKQQGVEVVLTRRTNTFVSLEERTEIANREGADLFLSIHVNASADASARGVETYFLNFAANPEAEAVAARENAGAARNMRHLPEIVKAIALNNKIDESRDFAAAVQRALHADMKKVNKDVRNLGVKQAPFMVLIGATMPSILAEISFLTNKQDATFLKTEKYRQQIAEALLAGVMKYQQSLKRQPVVAGR
jgi:N-acetylmuramoyl-L-alanine amidase